MPRNSALRGAAWLSVLIIANATPIGAMLQRTAAELEIGFLMGKDNVAVTDMTAGLYALSHPDIATHAWWVTFVVLTLFATYLGNIAVALWGDQPAASVKTDSAIADAYYRNGEKARDTSENSGSLLTRRIQL